MVTLREEIRVCEETINNSEDKEEIKEKEQLLEFLKRLESYDISDEMENM